MLSAFAGYYAAWDIHRRGTWVEAFREVFLAAEGGERVELSLGLEWSLGRRHSRRF